MQREIIYGKRILSIICLEKRSREIADYFTEIILELEKEFEKLMDKCKIPKQIIINLRKGADDIDGIYNVQSKVVSKYLIVIEIYTDKWIGMKRKDLDKTLAKMDLVNTFAHELIHHRYPKEEDTIKNTDEFIKKMILKKKLE